jgi:hypothetical protein
MPALLCTAMTFIKPDLRSLLFKSVKTAWRIGLTALPSR